MCSIQSTVHYTSLCCTADTALHCTALYSNKLQCSIAYCTGEIVTSVKSVRPQLPLSLHWGRCSLFTVQCSLYFECLNNWIGSSAKLKSHKILFIIYDLHCDSRKMAVWHWLLTYSVIKVDDSRLSFLEESCTACISSTPLSMQVYIKSWYEYYKL